MFCTPAFLDPNIFKQRDTGGMDSVWCDIPLDIQQKRLEEQLQIAADLKKPVLLHTKGQEKRIAELLRGFPYHICAHWYSGTEQDLEPYLDLGCYFTLGPDFSAACGSAADRRLLRGFSKEEKNRNGHYIKECCRKFRLSDCL